ncbi:MAG: T9SS type A sorting domain-containing protein, partial [Bacteroidota bacterium]|nr:T9SS type A sorting domain-containing protein [Bacteroidota bacterium]
GNDIINISWHTPYVEPIRLIISDMSGRILSDHALTSLAGTNKLQMDMSRFNPGLYIFTLQKQNSVEAFKWIKSE